MHDSRKILNWAQGESRQAAVAWDFHTDEFGNLQPGEAKSCLREVRYECKYDSQGNCTERLVSFRSANGPDFQRSNVERREILDYA